MLILKLVYVYIKILLCFLPKLALTAIQSALSHRVHNVALSCLKVDNTNSRLFWAKLGTGWVWKISGNDFNICSQICELLTNSFAAIILVFSKILCRYRKTIFYQQR